MQWPHRVVSQGKNPVAKDGKACAVAAGAAAADQPLLSVDQEEYYIPSVDLLTAQVMDSSCGTDEHQKEKATAAFASVNSVWIFFWLLIITN